jgi:uncharacterized protein (TIGR02186 family)
MRAARPLLVLALAPLLIGAAKPTLVPDVSQRTIDIAYSFTGADLLLYGAIVYPGGSAPGPDDKPADIIVVVRGPVQSVTVREKRKIAGIWINADSLRYRSAPSYYAVAASRPVGKLLDDRSRAIYELGLDSLQLSPASTAPIEQQNRFAAGLVALRAKQGLYIEAPDAVEITDGVLYRAHIHIPASVPVGRFTAETFLVRDGHVLAVATRTIHIRKSGFERFVAASAEDREVPYGLTVIAMAVGLGWAAGWIARRV